MVHTSCKRLHHALHFQFEKRGSEFGNGEIGAYGKHINLLVVLLLERSYDAGFRFAELWE